MRRLASLRPLSLALLLVGLSVTAARAQAPTASGRFSGPMSAGDDAGLYVTVAVGADAPGDVTATVDPLGVGRDTFVQRLSKSGYTGNGIETCPTNRQCFSADIFTDVRLVPGAHQVPVTITDSKGRSTRVSVTLHSTAPTDTDHDGLPDAWEQEFGLNMYSGAGDDGPSGDPDGDGISNLDEFKAGTNPRDKYVRLYAEGSSGAAQPLSTCVSVAALDPASGGAVHVLYVGDNGRHAAAWAIATDHQAMVCPLALAIADRVVEIRVESSVALAAERDIMTGLASAAYTYTGQLSNASLGVQEPSRSWAFADGHTADGMDMFLLLYNPTGAPVTADVAYIRAPSTVIAHTTRLLPPGIRTTIWVNQDQPDALGSDVSMVITADNTILAERAFRFHSPGRTVPHDSVTRGAWTTATHWYFPDMDSRGPFTSSLVVMNPSATSTRVTLTAQFPDRDPAHLEIALTAGERRELTLRDLPVPSGTTFGVIVDASDGVGIVAERASSGTTESGSWRRSAIGAMQPGTRWIFPTGGPLTVNDTDLVLLNVSDTTARVRIRMRFYGFECCDSSDATVEVPARGSLHVPIGYNDPARTINTLAAGTLTIDSIANSAGSVASIVVERTNYWDVDGVRHARASSVIGNQVQ